MARILVVDDEEIERALMRSILEADGHELVFATDGQTALDLCWSEAVDMVITDLAMPGFSGLRFIKELRELGDRIPIVAISGWAADQLDLAEDFGADATLFKPVNGEQLIRTIRDLLAPPKYQDHQDPWLKDR